MKKTSIYAQTKPSTLGILIWSNLFTGFSRLRGISGTIRLIRLIVSALPMHKVSLDTVSKKIDLIINRVPCLFIARKQKCLIRGLLLYFYGKRMEQNIHLTFGCKWEDKERRNLKTHCWIVHNGNIRFEVNDIIDKYVTLVEYK
ncbi:MAG: hypothetical protein JRI92_01715 [Deltaproteobacteria bacterium]|nr:hypothetical protein [Deltaproteobacteria bacterium]